MKLNSISKKYIVILLKLETMNLNILSNH